MDSYDVIVIGEGLDACEAAFAASKTAHAALLAENLDAIAIIEDTDVLWSEIQSEDLIDALREKEAALPLVLDSIRWRNKEKTVIGRDPVVLHRKMKHLLERTKNLDLVQSRADRITTASGKVTGVSTVFGKELPCHSVVVCVDHLNVDLYRDMDENGVFFTDHPRTKTRHLRAALAGAIAGKKASVFSTHGLA